MSKQLRVRDRVVELSDHDHHQLAEFGAEVGLNMLGTLHNSEALKRPSSGHAPRLAREPKSWRETQAEIAHSVIDKIKAARGQR
jgi:hypothetical protein